MFELWMVFVLLAVVVIGIAIGYAVGRSQGDAREKQKQAEEELSAYKEEVAQHFGKTAELFDKLTHDYREVYEHLAQSSENLCGDQVPRISADVPDGKLLSEENDGAAASIEVEPGVSADPESAADDRALTDADEAGSPTADRSSDSPDGSEADSRANASTTGEAAKSANPGNEPDGQTSNGEDDPGGATESDSPISQPRAAEAVDADSMSEDDDSNKSRG